MINVAFYVSGDAWRYLIDASITLHQYLCISISRPTLHETEKNIFTFITDIVYIRIWDKNGVIRVNNVQKLKQNMEIC